MKVYGVRMKTKESFEKEFYEEEIEIDIDENGNYDNAHIVG